MELVSIDNLSPDYRIFLVRSGAMDIKKRSLEIVSALKDMDYSIAIVSTNMPSKLIIESFEKAGVDISGVFFIDMVTSYATGKRQENTDQVLFVERPGDLTKAGILITNKIKESEGEKIAFIFDTINTMLIYSPQSSVTRFIHFIINKLRINDAMGFFMVVEKGIESDMVTDFEMLADISIPRDEPITLIKSELEREKRGTEEGLPEESDLR